MICISIGSITKIDQVNALKPSLVEIRYDLVRRLPDEVSVQFSESILQVATCRPGGYSDQQRMDILKRAIDRGAVYVDVELEASGDFKKEICAYAKERSTHVIISYHNFNETPSHRELDKILQSCYSSGGEVAKIACQTNTNADAARLLSLYESEGRKIVIGMGDAGRITRLAAIELGAEFSFAALSEEDATAPGQLSYQDLVSLWDKLKKK